MFDLVVGTLLILIEKIINGFLIISYIRNKKCRL